MTVSPILREQHFGVAEQKPWGDKGGWVRESGRSFKFPEGESLDDVRDRANQASVCSRQQMAGQSIEDCRIAQFIEKHIKEAEGKPAKDTNVVVVAHGIFNSQFLGALLARRSSKARLDWNYRGKPFALFTANY